MNNNYMKYIRNLKFTDTLKKVNWSNLFSLLSTMMKCARSDAQFQKKVEVGVEIAAAAIGHGPSHKPSLGAVSIDVPLARFPQELRSKLED